MEHMEGSAAHNEATKQSSDASCTILEAVPEDIPAIVHFVLAGRRDMFSTVPSGLHIPKVEHELTRFRRDFLDDPNGAFLTAKVGGHLVATIGYVAYDHRFPQLDLDYKQRGERGPIVVEIVKLYVDPCWRRAGLASRMLALLEQRALHAGVCYLYLHTHPFLPGAVRFWERQGFGLLCIDDDPVWRTTHMGKPLSVRG